MCVVSAVMPQVKPWVDDNWPTYGKVVLPDPQIAEIAKKLDRVLTKLEEVDKLLKLRDCALEAAEKQEVLDKLKDIIQAHGA